MCYVKGKIYESHLEAVVYWVLAIGSNSLR